MIVCRGMVGIKCYGLLILFESPVHTTAVLACLPEISAGARLTGTLFITSSHKRAPLRHIVILL
jgi:hypothetical protein